MKRSELSSGTQGLICAIYARVSTASQTEENQLRELRSALKARGYVSREDLIYIDHGISGAKSRLGRPAYDSLLKDMHKQKFDVVAAWSVDRLGRSLVDLLGFMEELDACGCDLYLHTQGIDTATPGGRMVFQIMGSLAEFEREMMRQRKEAGVARAREEDINKGKEGFCPYKNVDSKGNPSRFGRRRVDAQVEASVLDLRRKGLGVNKIRAELGIGTGTVQRILKESAQKRER